MRRQCQSHSPRQALHSLECDNSLDDLHKQAKCDLLLNLLAMTMNDRDTIEKCTCLTVTVSMKVWSREESSNLGSEGSNPSSRNLLTCHDCKTAATKVRIAESRTKRDGDVLQHRGGGVAATKERDVRAKCWRNNRNELRKQAQCLQNPRCC